MKVLLYHCDARARRVLAAFFAEALRAPLPRFRAVLFACLDRAARETVLFGSFFIAFMRARPRFVEPSSLVTGSSSPRRVSCAAFRRVSGLVVLGFGSPSGIPALLALLNPMAIACFAERAPCFPSRT